MKIENAIKKINIETGLKMTNPNGKLRTFQAVGKAQTLTMKSQGGKVVVITVRQNGFPEGYGDIYYPNISQALKHFN